MKKAFYLIPSCLLLGVLAVAVACGGGDDSSSGTPTGTGGAGSATQTNDAGSSPTLAPTATSNDTPPPAVGRDCDQDPNSNAGMISYLEFASGTNVFKAGDDIAMTLVLKNCASSATVLNYGSEARYDVSVQDANGVEVWRWSDTQNFADVAGSETFQPQQVVRYDATWDQKDSDGKRVDPGTYKISAFSLGCAQAPSENCYFGPVELVQISAGG